MRCPENKKEHQAQFILFPILSFTMKSIFAIATLAIAAVSAQVNIISVTSPLTGTVYTAGEPATISW
jgi:hypothetical protein